MLVRCMAFRTLISSRNSLLTRSGPREFHAASACPVQLEPVRCQPTTVSGWTMTSVRFHPDQNRRSITQKTLFGVVSLGRQRRLFKTVSCCRKAKTSSSNPGGNTDCMPSGPGTISTFGAYIVCIRALAAQLQSRFNFGEPQVKPYPTCVSRSSSNTSPCQRGSPASNFFLFSLAIVRNR